MITARVIGLTLALAWCCGVSAQGQQPLVAKPAAPTPTESTRPDTDYAPAIRTEADRIPATGFGMRDVPDGSFNAARTVTQL